MLSGWQIPYMINDILSIYILLLISKLKCFHSSLSSLLYMQYIFMLGSWQQPPALGHNYFHQRGTFSLFQRNHHIPSQISATASESIWYIHILDVCFLPCFYLWQNFTHLTKMKKTCVQPEVEVQPQYFGLAHCAWHSYGQVPLVCRADSPEELIRKGINQFVCIVCPKCSGTCKLCRK